MVAKIPQPIHNSLEIITRLADERRNYRDFYTLLKPNWLLAAEAYILNGGCPLQISPIDLRLYTASDDDAAARKDSLINLYTASETNFQYSLLASLRRDHGLIFCPCCGAHTVPGTLDHYLPKTHFPEFAVLLVNLTPMCNACQESKGAIYVTEQGAKKFIHSYYDDIDFIIYWVRFQGDLRMPEFTFEFDEGLPDGFGLLVREHVAGVNIKARFISYCGTKYTHLLKFTDKLRRREDIGIVLENFLASAEENSVNCWEAIFYRSVLASENVLAFLREGELPEML